MGKSYLFECAKCGYRAVVAGGVAEGNDLKVQTVRCRDCRTLGDSVIAVRSNTNPRFWNRLDLLPEDIRPSLLQVLNRLPASPSEPSHWATFEPACPANADHRIEPWTTPGRCPKCRAFMEGGGLPFRVWD